MTYPKLPAVSRTFHLTRKGSAYDFESTLSDIDAFEILRLRVDAEPWNEFAGSMLKALGSEKGPSHKQRGWAHVLATEYLPKANGETEPEPEKTTVDVSGILDLLATAKTHLKYPKTAVALDADRRFRVSLAGPRAKFPGSVTVTSLDADEYGERSWYGRIRTDGSIDLRRNAPDWLEPALVEFSSDPATIAANSGHLTGNCSFCWRPLKDERSTEVGYGKTCASHYGLPWGSKAADAARKSRLANDDLRAESSIGTEEEDESWTDRQIRVGAERTEFLNRTRFGTPEPKDDLDRLVDEITSSMGITWDGETFVVDKTGLPFDAPTSDLIWKAIHAEVEKRQEAAASLASA
jgi:hypothetical protein